MVTSVHDQPATSVPAPPPTPQEITRKLSVHNKPAKLTIVSLLSNHTHSYLARHALSDLIQPVNVLTPTTLSGTESDSDPFFSPEHSPLASSHLAGGSHPQPIPHSQGHAQSHSHSMSLGLSTSVSSKPLSSIAERRSRSGDEESDENEEADEEWTHDHLSIEPARSHKHDGDTIIKTGYLYKKGERRKTWKKRWFVLRPAHLAFYKNSAEYQLLRLLELSEVHSCSPVDLKRHPNSLVLVSPNRTYYLQADTEQEMHSWVRELNRAREALLGTSTQNSASTPIAIPPPTSEPRQSSILGQSPPGGGRISPSPPSARSIGFATVITSDSESEDQLTGEPAKSATGTTNASPPKTQASGSGGASKDSSKIILSGYLMKRRSKRQGWRKRWFVLTGDTLSYSASHMDTKRRRSIELSQVIDAIEYDLSSDKGHSGTSNTISPPVIAVSDDSHGHEGDSGNTGLTGAQYTFKIVSTKRPLLLCAPSEAEEIKWLSAVRALIARRTTPLVSPGVTQGAPGHTDGNTPAAGVKSSMSMQSRKRSTSGASGLTYSRDEHH